MEHTEQLEDKRNKVRTVFLLDPDNREKLDKLAADSGAPLGELLRRSVSTFLSQQERKTVAQDTGMLA